MKLTLPDRSKARARRRGVTLVEMLVTLAVLLLMMTAIVKIFQAATGSLNSAQVYQQLDNQLRQLDVTLRSDLSGVTAKMTPPNDPKNHTGYFEYGENEFADNQGEDADDYIRFTAKAPAGRPFTGRVYVPTTGFPRTFFNNDTQPITITSDYAEIIYFLRNGNLYRRVFLIAPERQSSITPTVGNVGRVVDNGGVRRPLTYVPTALGFQTSWLGVHDLSAHPETTGGDPTDGPTDTFTSVVLNTLGDLTNRENRAFYQRFSSDFQLLRNADIGADGLDDDANADNVPDYYPTLYPGVLAPVNAAGQLLFEFVAPLRPAIGVMAFPFVFPGAYSRPQLLDDGTAPYGWIHSPNPLAFDPVTSLNVAFNTDPLGYLNLINHNPIDLGDNLALPGTATENRSTWWAFPTWRETLSPSWVDPTVQVNLARIQPAGLQPRYADALPGVAADPNFLPAMQRPANMTPDAFAVFRSNPDNFTDGFGTNSAFWGGGTRREAPLWAASWEDDLIMTGVRSFDVKAFDNSRSDYADLGWGDDARITGNLTIPYLAATPAATTWNLKLYDTLAQTFAHEGRMPPLVADHRLDASYPNPTYNRFTGTFGFQYPAFPDYSSNIGDNNPAIVRLRRVWDSWSTAYTKAPANAVLPNGFPWGPVASSPPIYPSYPPPYPAPLRGIQIQIRVVDPSNQRIKSLTIRQDFTDKL